MATGGTGDVLTGMIAAWLAQLLDAEAACKLAVYLHGMAGDLAEADEGEVSMTAGDVAGHLGDAILELTARRKVVERRDVAQSFQPRGRGPGAALQPMTVITHSEAETAAVGRDLAPALSAGAVVLLYGDLGAGKTAFVRGLAEGLGVAARRGEQPDVHADPGISRRARCRSFHVDLYRLDDPREIDDLGLEEIGAGGVLAIEWAEKLPRADCPVRSTVRDRIARATATRETITDSSIPIDRYSDR